MSTEKENRTKIIKKLQSVLHIAALSLLNLSDNQLPEFGNRNEEVDAEDKF